MFPPPKVTVVIPNWNTARWLPGCLNGLREQTFRDFQIVLVDNGSEDESVELVTQGYPEVKLIRFPTNLGFAKAANAGLEWAQSEYIALLNVDTIPQPAWLATLVEVMDRSPAEIGSVTSKMLSLDNPTLIDDAGNLFSWYGSAQKRGQGQPATAFNHLEEVLSGSGGATLYRRSFFEAVGKFDEDFVSYLEDVDLGLRGQLLGYRCLFVPGAEIWHKWSGGAIPRPTYVTYSTRNRAALLLKNVPGKLLLKHWRTILYGQLYFFLVYKHPFASLRGYVALVYTLVTILKTRFTLQQQKKISTATLEHTISDQLSEPALTEIVRLKFNSRAVEANPSPVENKLFE